MRTFLEKAALAVGLVAACSAAPVLSAWVYAGQWPDPPDPNTLDGPYGAAGAGDGTFYVCDVMNHRVWCVNENGPQFYWGGYGSGPGQFIYPYFVAISPDNRVYVTDRDNKRVQYFTATGSFLGSWYIVAEGVHTLPTRIAVAPTGIVFVFVPTQHMVFRYTPSGSFLGSWGHDKLQTGFGLAVSPDIRVYVGEGLRDKVMVFTETGSFLGEWGESGPGSGEFGGIQGLAVNALGRVFVGDFDKRCVHMFTGMGSFITAWGSRGTGPGQFESILDVAVSPSAKTVFVTDTELNRVQWFREGTQEVIPASLGRVKALFR